MSSDFYADYAAAMRGYLESHREQDLGSAHKLGWRALHDEISMLVIIEEHFQLVDELARSPASTELPLGRFCCRR